MMVPVIVVFEVMWSGIANGLQQKEVTLGICSGVEVYIIMDHRTGKMCHSTSVKVHNGCLGVLSLLVEE